MQLCFSICFLSVYLLNNLPTQRLWYKILSLIYIKVTPALWLMFGFATLLLGWGPSHSPDAFWHTLVFWRVIFILWPFLCGAILMSHISIGTIPVCMFSKALWVSKSIKETGKKKDIEMGHKSVTKKNHSQVWTTPTSNQKVAHTSQLWGDGPQRSFSQEGKWLSVLLKDPGDAWVDYPGYSTHSGLHKDGGVVVVFHTFGSSLIHNEDEHAFSLFLVWRWGAVPQSSGSQPS